MIQISFVFAAAIILELLGGYMAVVGLSSKASLLLIILAVALEFSKIVIATVLYKNWSLLGFGFKMYLLPTMIFLMVVTSYGAYAYLIQEFSKTTENQAQLNIKITSLAEEKDRLEARQIDINKQISEIPPEFVTQKRRLSAMFQEEANAIHSRLSFINNELPSLRQQIIEDGNRAGTLGSLATAWGTTPELAIKILALMMVIVIDPLAITMLMVGNFLLNKRQHEKQQMQQQIQTNKKEAEDRQYELQKMEILVKAKKEHTGTSMEDRHEDESSLDLNLPQESSDKHSTDSNKTKLIFPNKPIGLSKNNI